MTPITMTTLMAPARVIPALRVRDFAQAIGAMTRMAAETSPLDAIAAEEVLARGNGGWFAYGRGVSIPHAMIIGLAEPLGVFARLDPALDLDAPDALPVDLMLLILSSGEQTTLLRALACGARRLRDRDVAARLRSAVGAEAIHAVLTSDAWRGDRVGPELHRAEGSQGRNLTNARRRPTFEELC